MMNPIVAIIFLTGSTCNSPLEQAPGVTVAYQVPCAVVLRGPVGNPFKAAQAPNEPAAAPVAAPVKTAARKTRCGGGKVIWLKKKNGKRRYRCA
jgi:hypothetical protein